MENEKSNFIYKKALIFLSIFLHFLRSQFDIHFLKSHAAFRLCFKSMNNIYLYCTLYVVEKMVPYEPRNPDYFTYIVFITHLKKEVLKIVLRFKQRYYSSSALAVQLRSVICCGHFAFSQKPSVF